MTSAHPLRAVRRLAFPSLLGAAFALPLAPSLTYADEPAPYTVRVEAPPAHVGSRTTARVIVQAAAGHHINPDYPTSLKLEPPHGVELVKTDLSKKNGGVTVRENEAVFDVDYTAHEAGQETIAGTLRFAVCTASTCDPRRAPVNVKVSAK